MALPLLSLLTFYGGISTVSAFLLKSQQHERKWGSESGRTNLGAKGKPKAVEQLDPFSGKVIQSFKSIAEASRLTEINKVSIAKAVSGKLRQAGTYLWRKKGDQSTADLYDIPPATHKPTVPIEQLDPVSGKVIRIFKSILEASQQTGISTRSIGRALYGRSRHAGTYLWRQQGDKAIPNLFEGTPRAFSTKQVPVEQLDPVSGKVIQSFHSIREASRQTGIDNSSIHSAVDGKVRHAGKFLWRRKGDQSTPDLFQSPPPTIGKAIPVEQLDPVTGEVIQSFKSITEAQQQTGISHGSIGNALNGRSRHAGTYLWRRQGDTTTPKLFESPPTPGHITRVLVPIEQLDPFSGKLIRSFESITEASHETGINYSSIASVLNGITLHAGTYVWRRKFDKIAPEILESASTQDNGQVPVPVEQLDPYSGCVIQRYDSIEEASQQSRIPSGDIHKVLSGKRRHAGLFLWKRQDDETPPDLFERISASGTPVPVEQLDPVTGKVIQRFESMSEASRQTGIVKESIRRAVHGQRGHAGKYLWRPQVDG